MRETMRTRRLLISLVIACCSLVVFPSRGRPDSPPKLPSQATLPQKTLPKNTWGKILTLKNMVFLNAGEVLAEKKAEADALQKAQADGKLMGCGKTDSPLLQPGQVPAESAFGKKGTVFYKVGTSSMDKDTDYCTVDPGTGLSLLYEFFCIDAGKGTAQVVEKPFPCKTGTVCAPGPNSGACVPQGSNGCFPGQLPILDSNHNGVLDACFCPIGTFPVDTNGDGNSDTCEVVNKGPDGPCNQLAAQATKKAEIVKKANGTENGGWSLYDFCSGPFTLTHVVCAVNEVMSTSTALCGPQQICQKGNCVDAGSDVCDPTNVDYPMPDPYTVGWVIINQGEKLISDTCNADKTGTENVFCACPTCGVGTQPAACQPMEVCEDGVCIKAQPENTGDADDFDGDGIPNGQDTDKNGDGVADPPNLKLCGDTTSTCDEETDAAHPIDPKTGQLLYGDVYIFGETDIDIEIETCPPIGPPSPPTTYPDECFWLESQLLPILTQYGCNEDVLASSKAPCNWSKGEACDWQAGSDEEKGICKKAGKAAVTATPATATVPGHVTGTNAFGHPVDHSDTCVPEQGPTTVKKWKLADTPEGAIAYLASCPELHHCKDGVCVPDPCFGKKYTDNNPCTDDFCDPPTGLPVYLPIPIDDNNFCTIDTCTNARGKAKITHEPITGGNCSGWTFCQQNPNDPTCKSTDPTVDCAKDPMDPACPPPPPVGGFDCGKCTDSTYEAAHPECAQCVQTLNYCYDEDPADVVGVRGTTYIFPGTPNQQTAMDLCAEWNDDVKQFTAILQVSCGPNNTFFFSKYACPPDTKGCQDGVCVAK